MTALAITHKAEIIEQVKAGRFLKEIAADLGCTKSAIHQVLQDDPDYRAALPIQADSLIQEAKIETWAAREALDIARAREITKFAFRYGEAVDPGRWSQKAMLVPLDGQQLVDAAIGQLAGALLTRMRAIDAPAIVDKSEQNSE